MQRIIFLLLLSLMFVNLSSANSSDLSEVQTLFESEDVIVYQSGPDSFCDTSCDVAGELSEATGMKTSLSTRPPTPKIGETDRNLILVGAPRYTNNDLGITNSFDEEDTGQLILTKTSSNDRYVVVVRASNEKALKSAGTFLKELLTGKNMDEVSGRQKININAHRYGEEHDLSNVSEIFGDYTLVVYGADTRDAKRNAQELALKIGGEAVDDDDLSSSEKKNRHLILLGTPGTNQYTEELAKQNGVWSRYDWRAKDGFRVKFVENAFNYGSHALIVSTDTMSALGATTDYVKYIVNGDITEGLEGRTVIRESTSPIKNLNLSLDVNKETATVGETINIVPVADGKNVEATLKVNGRPYGTGENFELKMNSSGNHTLSLTKGELMTYSEIRRFNDAEKTIMVEPASLVQKIERFFSDLFG